MKANIAWNTIGSVFYQGCLWLMTVLVVRLSADYQNSGMLAFAMSIGNIYTALGTYTMRTYQVSDVKNENSAGNYVALRFVTVFGALIACGIYGLAVSPTPATLIVVAAFLLFKADESFVNVMYGCDQKAMRLDYVGQSQIIRGCLVVGIFVGGMLLTGSLALTLVLIFLGCLSVTVFFDTRKTSAVVDSLRPRITRERCLRLLRVCLPSVAGNVIGGLVISATRQYFGISFGESALGIYASVATPCVIIQVLAQNLYTPLLGPIAEKDSAGDAKAARSSALRLFLLVGGVAAALSVALSIFAEPLLTLLYGETIVPYVGLLPFAMIVTTEVALNFVLTDLLIVYKRLTQTFVVNGIAFAVMALSVKPCTDLWYMNGLNYSLIVAYTISAAYGLVVLFLASRGKKDQAVITK